MSVAGRTRAPIVALDIGNVCLKIDPSAALRILGLGDRPTFLFSPELLKLVEAAETGSLGTAGFVSAVAGILPGQHSMAAVQEAWLAILGIEMPGMAEWVRDAHLAGLRVILFSDTSELHYRALLPRLSFAGLVEGAVLSYEVGCRKPGPEMYRVLEEQFCGGGCPSLYIDDREENISAARDRGWRTYRFGDIAGARAALSEALRHPVGQPPPPA